MKVLTLPGLKTLRALRESVDVFQEKNTRRTRSCSLKPSLQCPLGFRVGVPYYIIAVDLTMRQPDNASCKAVTDLQNMYAQPLRNPTRRRGLADTSRAFQEYRELQMVINRPAVQSCRCERKQFPIRGVRIPDIVRWRRNSLTYTTVNTRWTETRTVIIPIPRY